MTIEQPERRLQHLHPPGHVHRHDDRADDDDGVEEGQRRPDLDEPLTEQIELAADVSEHGADSDADAVSDQHDQQRKRQRDVEAVRQADEHVAPAVVGAERVLPRRRMRRESRQVEQRLVRAVRIGRHEHPVARRLLPRTARAARGSRARRMPAWPNVAGGIEPQHREVVARPRTARRARCCSASSGRTNETTYAPTMKRNDQ